MATQWESVIVICDRVRMRLQLLSSHDLLDIPRVAIEHENQCFVIEVGHLGVEVGHI